MFQWGRIRNSARGNSREFAVIPAATVCGQQRVCFKIVHFLACWSMIFARNCTRWAEIALVGCISSGYAAVVWSLIPSTITSTFIHLHKQLILSAQIFMQDSYIGCLTARLIPLLFMSGGCPPVLMTLLIVTVAHMSLLFNACVDLWWWQCTFCSSRWSSTPCRPSSANVKAFGSIARRVHCEAEINKWAELAILYRHHVLLLTLIGIGPCMHVLAWCHDRLSSL